MFKLQKSIATLAITGTILVASIGVAHAFQMPEQRNSDLRPSGVASFATDNSGAGQADGLLLSPEEIQHVKWCASRFMSYHASDNTYADKTGVRVECKSPY